jgi:concentrative nucleoside transporter, CNT family
MRSGMTWGLPNIQSLIGIPVLLALAWAISSNRKVFPFRLAAGVLTFQFLLALLLFGVPAVSAGFRGGITAAITALKAASVKGTEFVFGVIGNKAILAGVFGKDPGTIPPNFAFEILPLVIGMAALAAVLWHWRILQWITRAMAFVFERTTGLAGPTALVVAAKLFLGMTEAPLLVRPYLAKLARQDLFLIMTVGFATIAGSVLVLYATMLEPLVPGAGAHLFMASLLSAPGAVLFSRVVYPGSTTTKDAVVPPNMYSSTMDALATGTNDGLKLFLNIIAMLLAVIFIIALFNGILGALPDVMGAPLSLERILGWIFAPIMWLVGVPADEMVKAGQFVGLKMAANEFIAYAKFAQTPAGELSERTRLLLTYSLCGFANFSSIAIMTGALTALIPDRRDDVLKLVTPAMFVGTLATLMSAAVIGALPDSMFGH